MYAEGHVVRVLSPLQKLTRDSLPYVKKIILVLIFTYPLYKAIKDQLNEYAANQDKQDKLDNDVNALAWAQNRF